MQTATIKSLETIELPNLQLNDSFTIPGADVLGVLTSLYADWSVMITQGSAEASLVWQYTKYIGYNRLNFVKMWEALTAEYSVLSKRRVVRDETGKDLTGGAGSTDMSALSVKAKTHVDSYTPRIETNTTSKVAPFDTEETATEGTSMTETEPYTAYTDADSMASLSATHTEEAEEGKPQEQIREELELRQVDMLMHVVKNFAKTWLVLVPSEEE